MLRKAFTQITPPRTSIITSGRIAAPEGTPGAPPAPFKISLLWDTGAESTLVRQTVIAALGVHPIGSSWIVDYAGHKRLAPEYLVNLLLPNGTTVPDIKVSVCEEPGYDEDADAWDVLVGMNVITMGAFSLTSDEHGSMFSFCIPHDGHLDYAHRFAERNNLILKRAGRNGRAVMVDPESGERRDLKIKEAVALRKQGWVIAEISESTKKQQRSSRN